MSTCLFSKQLKFEKEAKDNVEFSQEFLDIFLPSFAKWDKPEYDISILQVWKLMGFSSLANAILAIKNHKNIMKDEHYKLRNVIEMCFSPKNFDDVICTFIKTEEVKKFYLRYRDLQDLAYSVYSQIQDKGQKGGESSLKKIGYCAHPGCNEKPYYNYKDEKSAKYCLSHKENGMICVIYPTCNYGKQWFYKSYSLDFRVGLQYQCLCNKPAEYGLKGTKCRILCEEHKAIQPKDQSVEMARTYYHGFSVSACPVCGVERATRREYNGYCQRCFIYTFPDNKLVINYKTKERAVADYVRREFNDKSWVFDRIVDTGCSRRRPDILLDMGDHVILVEIDENQHHNYDCLCENKRLMQLFTDIGSRPLTVIRFNPDSYIACTGIKCASCWTTDKKGMCVVKKNHTKVWSSRLETLKRTLEMCIEGGNNQNLNLIHLYYDGYDAE